MVAEAYLMLSQATVVDCCLRLLHNEQFGSANQLAKMNGNHARHRPKSTEASFLKPALAVAASFVLAYKYTICTNN